MFRSTKVQRLVDTKLAGFSSWLQNVKKMLKSEYECKMFINPTCIRGIRFFKQSLMYSPDDIGQRFILFVDKDFSYIEVV